MDNRRTDTARENDDSDIIENLDPTPSHGGSSGGNMQRDIGTEATLERIRDPEATEGVDKQNDIDHAQRYETNHPADKQPGNRSD
ncbi:MAG: hypothetical protein ACJ8F4_05100 [Sphingomonas sp.]|jgi:hypothetical protein